MFDSTEYSEGKSLGKRVYYQGKKYGTLQYFGPTHFAEGLWCGLELDKAVGENDGLVDDFRYFTCKKKFGLFVLASETSLVNKSEDIDYLDVPITGNSNSSSISHLKDSNYISNSPEKAQRNILNESYTVSIGFHQKNKLSLIAEESIEPLNCSESVGASYFFGANINDCENISANHTFVQQPVLKTSNNQITEVPGRGIKYSENDLVDSDESLGILPSAILDDCPWDNLVSDVENTNDILNVTHNVAKDLTDFNNIVSDFQQLEEATSVASNVSDVSFSLNPEEIPVEKDESFSIYASTPKHETNFSDVYEEIENALNLTHNLSTEFAVNHNLSKDENPFVPTSSYKNIFETTEGIKDMSNMAEKCLNVTYSAENEHISEEKTINLENKSKNYCGFQNNNVLPNETRKILNETFEKVLEISSDNINTQSCDRSKLSAVSMKENISFLKDKSRHSLKYRKSLGYLSSTNALTEGINIKNVRRHSVSSNSDISRDNVSKNKVTQLSVSSHKNLLQKTSVANLIHSKENSVNRSSMKNSLKKHSIEHLSMRTKYPDGKNKNNSTPKSKFCSNQQCLNKTINVEKISEVGKTVVKKPRHSLLFSKSSPDHFVSFPSRNRSKTTINKMAMPSELKKHTASTITVKTKVSEKLNGSFSSLDRTSKLSAGTLDEKAVRKSRLFDKHISAEKNIPSISNCSGVIKPRRISAFKEKFSSFNKDINNALKLKKSNEKCNVQKVTLNETMLVPEKCINNHPIEAFKENISISNKDINNALKLKKSNEKFKVEKVTLNETVLVPKKRINSHPLKGIKQSSIKKPSCIPQSRIPFITGSKPAAQLKCIDVNLPSTSEDSNKYSEKGKSSCRMVLRSARRIKSPTHYISK